MDRRQAQRPQRVLVVDDSDDVREMLRLVLTRRGFAVVEASDGAEAVVKAVERCPDLVLLDVRMPIMDGLEALRQLRAEARTAHVPIIMVSAQPDQAERARALGSNGFVAKPAPPDALLKQIRAVLGRTSSTRHDAGAGMK
jgi:two-component system phosphate regulon response regulator PhoB